MFAVLVFTFGIEKNKHTRSWDVMMRDVMYLGSLVS
jgi:hypothetical protein